MRAVSIPLGKAVAAFAARQHLECQTDRSFAIPQTERRRRFERTLLLSQRYSRLIFRSSPPVARHRVDVLVRLECGGVECQTRGEPPETRTVPGSNGKERSKMRKGDRITIAVLVVLGVVALVAIGVMTLLGAPEYLEFAVAMAMFAAILVGSYLFVITPQKQREEERDTD